MQSHDIAIADLFTTVLLVMTLLWLSTDPNSSPLSGDTPQRAKLEITERSWGHIGKVTFQSNGFDLWNSTSITIDKGCKTERLWEIRSTNLTIEDQLQLAGQLGDLIVSYCVKDKNILRAALVATAAEASISMTATINKCSLREAHSTMVLGQIGNDSDAAIVFNPATNYPNNQTVLVRKFTERHQAILETHVVDWFEMIKSINEEVVASVDPNKGFILHDAKAPEQLLLRGTISL